MDQRPSQQHKSEAVTGGHPLQEIFSLSWARTEATLLIERCNSELISDAQRYINGIPVHLFHQYYFHKKVYHGNNLKTFNMNFSEGK